MCIATLDAEKCFDSIWNDGLFFKLIDIISETEWRFMYKWYKSLDVVIKWNGVIHYDSYFKVTRGTKQGSILSPTLFNRCLCIVFSPLVEVKKININGQGKVWVTVHLRSRLNDHR